MTMGRDAPTIPPEEPPPLKTCSQCGGQKFLGEFYKDKRTALGVKSECKECFRADRRRRARTQLGRKVDRRAAARHKEKNPHKNEARRMAALYVTLPGAGPDGRAGEGLQRHHWSYKKDHWKDVFVLTREDHDRIHERLVYDEEDRCFRTMKGGTLLDTKEKHEKFMCSLGIEEAIERKPLMQ